MDGVRQRRRYGRGHEEGQFDEQGQPPGVAGGGRLTDLAVPGASATQALGVNDHDEVAGDYTVGSCQSQGPVQYMLMDFTAPAAVQVSHSPNVRTGPR